MTYFDWLTLIVLATVFMALGYSIGRSAGQDQRSAHQRRLDMLEIHRVGKKERQKTAGTEEQPGSGGKYKYVDPDDPMRIYLIPEHVLQNLKRLSLRYPVTEQQVIALYVLTGDLRIVEGACIVHRDTGWPISEIKWQILKGEYHEFLRAYKTEVGKHKSLPGYIIHNLLRFRARRSWWPWARKKARVEGRGEK